jgi:hypothetical protein
MTAPVVKALIASKHPVNPNEKERTMRIEKREFSLSLAAWYLRMSSSIMCRWKCKRGAINSNFERLYGY